MQNLFKWFTRQLSLHGLLPNDVLYKKLHWTPGCTTSSSYIYNRFFFLNHLQITGWGKKRVLKTHHRGLWIFSTNGRVSPKPVHQQHANEVGEMILLHLNMSKAILSPLSSICPCHIPPPPPTPTLDILVLVNQILFSGGNPESHIADWIGAQIGAGRHSSFGPCVSFPEML